MCMGLPTRLRNSASLKQSGYTPVYSAHGSGIPMYMDDKAGNAWQVMLSLTSPLRFIPSHHSCVFVMITGTYIGCL